MDRFADGRNDSSGEQCADDFVALAFTRSAVAAQQVSFTAAVTDLDNDTLVYHWIFGDGKEDIAGSANETHTYTADGTYAVQLIVNDGKGGVAEKDVSVIVGTGQAPGVIQSVTIKKSFTLNFKTPVHSSLDFTLYNSAFVYRDKSAFYNDFDGANVNVYIGSTLIDTFALDRTRGTGFGHFTFTYRTGRVRYLVRNNPELVSLLDPYGASNATVKKNIFVPLRIEFDSTRYGDNANFTYSGRAGKTGTGR